jgi:putative beta-lysine N-acetyltransferase
MTKMETLKELKYGEYTNVEQDDFSTELFIDFQSERLKLIKYTGDTEKIIKNTIDLCGKFGMGKILATVHEEHRKSFINNGFIQEAVIDGFFKGKIGYNVSYFYDTHRSISHRLKEEDKIIEKAKESASQFDPIEEKIFSIRTATIKDAEAMACLYDTVFRTYPTPMDNADYIKNVIRNNEVLFKIAEYNNEIISAASADLNYEFLNAEITDCATSLKFRKNGLLSELVYALENSLKEMNFIVLFSVARAISPGINIVFSKHGYEYTGRQINNSNIMGNLEDMNIWVKKL